MGKLTLETTGPHHDKPTGPLPSRDLLGSDEKAAVMRTRVAEFAILERLS